jgi:RNA polymerase sigma factor (sigma-70 family)
MSEVTPDVIARCLKGEEGAWVTLYKAALLVVEAYGLRQGLRNADLEDFCAEILIRVHKRLHKLDDPVLFYFWLNTIMKRGFIDLFTPKKLAFRERLFKSIDEPDSAQFVENLASVWFPPDASLELAERGELVERFSPVLAHCVGRLKVEAPDASRAINLRYFKLYSLARIAKAMRRTVQEIEFLIECALARLNKWLAEAIPAPERAIFACAFRIPFR